MHFHIALLFGVSAFASNPFGMYGDAHNATIDALAQSCAIAPGASAEHFAADVWILAGGDSTHRQDFIDWTVAVRTDESRERTLADMSPAFRIRYMEYLSLARGFQGDLISLGIATSVLDDRTKSEFGGLERVALLVGGATLISSAAYWSSDRIVPFLPGDSPPTYFSSGIDWNEVIESDVKDAIIGVAAGAVVGAFWGPAGSAGGAIAGGAVSAGLSSFVSYLEQDAVRDYIEDHEGDIGGPTGPCTPPYI